MKRFNVFLTDREYEQGSLQKHLEYLRMFGGTPDSLANFEDFHQAKEFALEKLESNGHDVIIYDEVSEKTFTFKISQLQHLIS